MSETNAWKLSFSASLRAAVGEFQLIHIFDQPELFEVPCTPLHCHQVLVWQEDVLPVMDIDAWVNPYQQTAKEPFAGIVAFQQSADMPVQYGCIKLIAPPQRIRVSDSSACEIPEENSFWLELSLASFRDADGQVLMVLNLPKLFSGDLASIPPDVGSL